MSGHMVGGNQLSNRSMWERINSESNPSPNARAWGRQLRAWCDEQPDPHRKALCQRLKSSDEAAFYSAAFELYWSDWLKRAKYRFEREPSIAGSLRRPDFCVTTPDEISFYLEVTVALDSSDQRTQERVQREIDGILRERQAPWKVLIVPRDSVPGGFSKKRFRAWLNKTLEDLGSRPVGTEKTRVFQDAVGDIPYKLSLTFVAREKSGPIIGARMPRGESAFEIGNDDLIRKKVDQKLAQYGSTEEFQLPYVVSLDLCTSLPAELQSVSEIMWGPLEAMLTEVQGCIVPTGSIRKATGLFNTASANGEPQRRRISAVILHHRSVPGGADDREAEHREIAVFHNPQAKAPLTDKVFGGLPQAHLIEKVGRRPVVQWTIPPPEWCRGPEDVVLGERCSPLSGEQERAGRP